MQSNMELVIANLQEMKVVIKAVAVQLMVEIQEHEASGNEADEKKAAWKVA